MTLDFSDNDLGTTDRKKTVVAYSYGLACIRNWLYWQYVVGLFGSAMSDTSQAKAGNSRDDESGCLGRRNRENSCGRGILEPPTSR